MTISKIGLRSASLRARRKVLQALRYGCRRIALRAGFLGLREQLHDYHSAALIYLAARLGLADLLTDGPRRSDDLARSLGAHAASLHRVLRGLVVIGICSQERDGRFAITRLGLRLQTGKPGSLRASAILCGEEFSAAWFGLLHSVMSGGAAFDHVYGMSSWEHREQHSELNDCFNAEFRHHTALAARAVQAVYDFSSFPVMVDVGGGHGALVAALLKTHPSATGILFDLPHVVARAREYLETVGVAARCRIVGGSFFEHVPEGEALILKSVIHDWDDESSLKILKHCHRSLKPRGRLILLERIMPARPEQAPEVIMGDLHMLAVTGGRERSEIEYLSLFAASGFRLTRVIKTWYSLCVIEGVRAEDESERA
jgi:SAM-dependent methyltransferase